MGLLKNASIYSVSNLLQRGVSFLLLPLYTRFLLPEDYGITGVIGALIPVLMIFFALSIRASVVRLYFAHRGEQPDRIPLIWGAALSLVLLISFLISGVFFIFGWLSGVALFEGIAFYPFVALGIFTAAFQAVFELYQASLKARQLAARHSVLQLLLFLLQLLVSITLVVVFNWGAMGVLTGNAAASFIMFVYVLVRFIPEVRLNLRGDLVREVLGFSLPLVPHALATWTSGMINRFFLNNMVGTAAAGLFSVGFMFGSLVNIITTGVNQAFTPWFYDRLESEEDRREEIVSAANTLILCYTYISLSISLLSSLMIQIMTESSYHQSWIVVPVISFAYAFNALYFIASGVLFAKRIKLVPVITIVSSSLGILANWLLIPPYGMLGAAYATFLTFFLASIISAILGTMVYAIGFQWLRLFGTIIIGMLITYIALGLETVWVNLGTVAAMGVVVLLIERKNLSGLIRKLRFSRPNYPA